MKVKNHAYKVCKCDEDHSMATKKTKFNIFL